METVHSIGSIPCGQVSSSLAGCLNFRMEKEIILVARRKNELESRYADFRSKGLDTASLETEARQLIAYEQYLLASEKSAAAPTTASDAPTILCCHCGVLTEVNDARACYSCIWNRGSIVDAICENSSVNFCKSCERYEHGSQWLRCEWESKELLALCLKRLKKSKALRLVNAEFIWTESHSRRIKIRATFEGEVDNVTLRQSKDLTYVISHKQCEECCKSVTPHVWVSSVQVRQRSEFKRSMMFLEQLVLKNQAHRECSNIVDIKDGLDFHFLKPQHAQTLAQFVRAHICCKIFPIATQLVSHDAHSNVYRNKYTQIIELCPINREDLVFVAKKLSARLGGIPQILLCDKINRGVRLIDPFSRQIVDIDSEKFFKISGINTASGSSSGASGGYDLNKNLIKSVVYSTAANLTEYVVLNANIVQGKKVIGRIADQAYTMAELELCKCTDFGKNDKYVNTITHLGAHIKVGDLVLAYDLSSINISDDDADLSDAIEHLRYDVIVVKKQSARKRHEWEWQTLPREYMSAGRSGQAKVADGDRVAVEEDIEALAEKLQDLEL